MKKIIEQIEKEARPYFKNASGCHDWMHVERVRVLAKKIGKIEKADQFVIETAVLLHDIGRRDEMRAKGRFCHAEKSAELAAKILKKYKLSDGVVANIIHSIIAHRFRNSHLPATLEAKCVYDADKLDSIGAVGIGRDFLFAGFAGSRTLYTGNEKAVASGKIDRSYTKDDSALLEYEVKLKHVKDKMLTKTGKKLALERHRFMADFFKRFELEVKGIK